MFLSSAIDYFERDEKFCGRSVRKQSGANGTQGRKIQNRSQKSNGLNLWKFGTLTQCGFTRV